MTFPLWVNFSDYAKDKKKVACYMQNRAGDEHLLR